jgi:hypothetical protein
MEFAATAITQERRAKALQGPFDSERISPDPGEPDLGIEGVMKSRLDLRRAELFVALRGDIAVRVTHDAGYSHAVTELANATFEQFIGFAFRTGNAPCTDKVSN